jgi:hypothetical protein
MRRGIKAVQDGWSKLSEVEPFCSLELALEIVVLQSIGPRLCDLVLGGGVETLEKF